MVNLSVIICTSPGREANLADCLGMLRRQDYADFEVLVVDDGSVPDHAHTQRILAEFNHQYHWRPNDCCPSRSRNMGARMAQGPFLIFIDADILLNPMALSAYAYWLSQPPLQSHLLYGYYGQMIHSFAPSIWFPETVVLWEDARFQFNRELGELAIEPNLGIDLPRWCWSGNMGIRKTTFEHMGGFNESFIGWGREDSEFALRALLQGNQIHFTLDTWAEHQVHTRQEPFHTMSPAMTAQKDQWMNQLYAQYSPPAYPIGIYRSPWPSRHLMHALQYHYVPQSRIYPHLLEQS